MQGVLGSWPGDPLHQQHAGREVRAVGARLRAGSPPAPVRVEQVRELFGALAPVALPLGDDVGELDRAGDRDVLQHRNARQPAAERLHDQRGQRVPRHGDRERAHVAVGAAVPAQPQQARDGVAVLGDAAREHVAERHHVLVVEYRRPGLGVHQVQPQPKPAAQRVEGRRSRFAGNEGQPQQVVELGDVAELLGPVLVVGLGDGPHDVAEPDRVRHGEQGQLELADPLGELGRHRCAARAKPDHQPARADPRQPLGEVHLRVRR